VNEITNLVDRPEYLVFSPKYNLIVAKAGHPHLTRTFVL
jgi:hypothetical protein